MFFLNTYLVDPFNQMDWELNPAKFLCQKVGSDISPWVENLVNVHGYCSFNIG